MGDETIDGGKPLQSYQVLYHILKAGAGWRDWVQVADTGVYKFQNGGWVLSVWPNHPLYRHRTARKEGGSEPFPIDALPVSHSTQSHSYFSVPYEKKKRSRLPMEALKLAQWMFAGNRSLDDVLDAMEQQKRLPPSIGVLSGALLDYLENFSQTVTRPALVYDAGFGFTNRTCSGIGIAATKKSLDGSLKMILPYSTPSHSTEHLHL